jgi:hypothetical protein
MHRALPRSAPQSGQGRTATRRPPFASVADGAQYALRSSQGDARVANRSNSVSNSHGRSDPLTEPTRLQDSENADPVAIQPEFSTPRISPSGPLKAGSDNCNGFEGRLRPRGAVSPSSPIRNVWRTPLRDADLASFETAPSKRDQFRFPLTKGISGPTKRTRAQSRSGSCSALASLPPAVRASRPSGLERSLGSGLQIAQDGEHPSVVGV